jgi:hypothetical protein
MQMERAWSYLVDLCAGGPRTTGTSGERAAANRIAGWLGRLGCRVERQLFWAPKATLYWGPSLVMAAVAASLLVGRTWPWLGLALALLALLPLLGELCGLWPDLGLILPRAASQNVVGYLPSQGTLRQRLVLVAHIDTQRAGLLFHPRLVRLLPLYFHLAYALLTLALVAVLARVAWLSLLLAGLLALNALFLWWCGWGAKETVGANDNGSGVALVLALGEHLTANRPTGVEVVLLCTGAEEVGSRGMRRFLAEREFGPETIFINLDNLGCGLLHALQGEGMLRYHRYDPELVAMATQVAAPGELQLKRNLLLPTDAQPACQLGYRAITFISFAPDGSIPNYHWPTDRLDGIDQLQLARTERFLRRYLAALMDSARLGQPRQDW